jgi:hypothetical protein
LLQRIRALWHDQQGMITVYLCIILVPLMLFCGVLIDVIRYKTAQKEGEQAVKAGVRSTMSAFSPALQSYGLYGMTLTGEAAGKLFDRTVSANVSVSEGTSSQPFRFIDHQLEKGSTRVTPVYSLANHTVFKRQILEEMKYRAPMQYSLEISDKFRRTGLAGQLGQAAQFGENAAKIEKLLEQRDAELSAAWDKMKQLHRNASDFYPFYKTQLRDLNELSGRIGIHTIEEVRTTLQGAQQELQSLQSQVQSLDRSIMGLITAGPAAAQSIQALIEAKQQLLQQLTEASQLVSQYEQLLRDLTQYAQLLAMLKLKTAQDLADLNNTLEAFQTALRQAKQTNDQLNTELRSLPAAPTGQVNGPPAASVFQSIDLMERTELDKYEADVGAAVALFSGLETQIGDGLLFKMQKYTSTDTALESFRTQLQTVYTSQSAKESQREARTSSVNSAKREQRNRTNAVLDQVKRSLGVCSLVESVDPFAPLYIELQGDPAKGTKGFYQTYMEVNQAGSAAQAVPVLDLDSPDRAGLGALKLLSGLEALMADVRDEFYVDEFAVSKFSYRTLGLEKDVNSQVKTSKELSMPEQHPLTNQELEYMLYGGSSCAGNYTMAYAEMFAVRLAIGTTEALLEPRNELLAAGSPLLVLLAAVAEGAVKAQSDMFKLVQGDSVPLSQKLSGAITVSYKEYLRLFFLLHSRDKVMLARLQALLQLNTGIDLGKAATYVSGHATTSIRLWFIPGVIRALKETGFGGCEVAVRRCKVSSTADFTY